jgi:hypothetical protein
VSKNTSHGPAKSIMVAPSINTKATGIFLPSAGGTSARDLALFSDPLAAVRVGSRVAKSSIKAGAKIMLIIRDLCFCIFLDLNAENIVSLLCRKEFGRDATRQMLFCAGGRIKYQRRQRPDY